MGLFKKAFGSVILIYLRALSKIQLQKNKPIIVGITGSTGKTSLRDAVKLALSVKYRVKITEKANSESGIPLDILGLHMNDYSLLDWIRVCFLAPIKLFTNWEKFDIYVVEMGVDSPKPPKNMGYLLKIIKPHIGIVLNVSAVHSEQYDYLVSKKVTGGKRINRIIEIIAKEKGKLLTSIPVEGFSIINTDDNNIIKLIPSIKSQLISFGTKNTSDICITSIKQDNNVFRVKLLIDKNNYTIELKESYLPDAYGYIFAGAISVAYALKVDLNKAIKNLSEYKLPPGRMSVLKGINNSKIIDGSYNASSLSMIQSLNLAKYLSKGKRDKVVLALGDMREMGEQSKYEHELIAEESSEIADRIVLVGPLMRKYFYPKIIKLGFNKNSLFLFEKSSEAGKFIKNQLVKDGDVIMVKGSQNQIYMENVVEQLLESNSDISKLCRRGKYWDKIRSDY